MQEPKKFSENLTFSWVSQKANNPNKWHNFHNLDELEKRERILSLIFHLQLDVTDVRRICCLGSNETGLMNHLTDGLLDQFTTPSATQTAATKLEVMFVNLSLDPSYVAKNWNGLHYLRNKFRRDGTPSNGRCPFDQNQTICGCWGTPTRMKNAFINTANVDRLLKWHKSNVRLAVSWDLTDYDGEVEDDEELVYEDDEEIVPTAEDAPPVDNAQANAPIEDYNRQHVTDLPVEESRVSGNPAAGVLGSSAELVVTDDSPFYAELMALCLEATVLCSRIPPRAADVASSSSGVSVITISDNGNSEVEESASISTDDSVILLAENIESDEGMNHQVDSDILHSGSSKQVESVVEVQMDQDPVVDNHEFESGSGLNDGSPNSWNQTLKRSRTEELVNSEINGKESILKGSSSLREHTGSQQASELLIPNEVRPLGPTGQDYDDIVLANGGELPNSEMVFENLGHRHVSSDASARAAVKALDQEYNSTFNGHLVAEHHETEEVPDRNNVINGLEPDHKTAPVKDSHGGERIPIILNHGNGGSEDNPSKAKIVGKMPVSVAEQLINGSHGTEEKEERLGRFIAEERSPRRENASVRENSSVLPDHSTEIRNGCRYQDSLRDNQETMAGRCNEDSGLTANSIISKTQKLQLSIEGQPPYGNRSTEEKVERLEKFIGKLKLQGKVKSLKQSSVGFMALPQKSNAVESENISLIDKNSKVCNGVENKSSLKCGHGAVQRRDNEDDDGEDTFNCLRLRKRPTAGRVKITMTEDEVNSNILRILEAAQPHLLNPTTSVCVDSETTNVILSANRKPRTDRRNQQSSGKHLNEHDSLLPSFARENKDVLSQLTVEDFIKNCLSLPVLESNRKSRKTLRKITKIGDDVGCSTKGEPSKKSFSERFSRLIKLVTPPKQLTKRKRAGSSRKRPMQFDESEAPLPKVAIESFFAESSFDLINKLALKNIMENPKPGAEQDLPDLTGIDRVLQNFLVKMDQGGNQ
ncbi:hypothetical protein CAEBREN_22111 [Caenorhabditis brenneri]|uniref:Uncharacterized protein n=1 Tax=Caenorhabditis brenneri TaxID=135651 RepID=G0MQP8_CAEBE|nr:hypothetical protein CAEBREN_22111 [Caenorhabditis brenneri]